MSEFSEETIYELLDDAFSKNTETEKVEFKDARGGSVPKDIWKPISAFSNSPSGGVIIFGVCQTITASKTTLRVVGGLELETLQQKVISYINEEMKNCGQFSPKTIKYHNENLLALAISESPREKKPCYRERLGMPKGACIRVGNTNRQITEEELRAFLRYSPEYKYDRTPLSGIDMAILSNSKINDFLDKSAKRTGRRFEASLPFEKILKNLGLVVIEEGKPQPTLAGCLIFSRDIPQQLEPLSRYTIRCVRYAGNSPTSPIVDQQDIYGTLDEQIDNTHKFVLRNIPVRADIVGTQRVEKYEYPEDAIREIVANAIIHRDYIITGTYVQINVFADRLEISNPGTLPPGVTIENLKESQFSRNEVIANVMRELNYMEEFGRGIDLVYARMSEWNLVEPLFKNRSNMFKVTLLGERFKSLNERQIKIWHYLQDNNQITAVVARKIFPKVSRATINNDLKGMVIIGLINVKGAASNTYYEPKY